MNRRLLLALAALLTLTPVTLRAQRSLEIQQFTATLRVDEDGGLEVLESIRIRFNGSWNGFYRAIPVEYRNPMGFSYRLFLRVESVTDESGRELRTEISRDGYYRKVKIWVPEARDVARTVTLRYRVPNALRFFEDHDELYWNVTGTEWEMRIRSASAMVELPPGATGLKATAFTGTYGSSGSDASVQQIEDGFYIETLSPLEFREGLTVVVGWDPGVVSRPGYVRKASLFLRANWLLFMPLLSFFLMLWIWRTWGRDPARRSIAPAYEPPEGLTPGEVGTLVDNRPDTRDITATLVDLAVRGHLRIEQVERKGVFGLMKDEDFRFVRLTDPEEWVSLKPHEADLLRGLFGTSGYVESVELSDLRNEFYKTLSSIRDHIFRALVDAGFYRHRPDKTLASFIVLGFVSLGVAIPGFQLLANIFMTSPVSALVAGVLFAAPVLLFGLFMPARTVAGTRALEKILGFQEFLDRVESDRYKRLASSPQTFEAYLPFAMALGVESKWARAFEEICTEPPEWYVGVQPHAFRAGLFVNDLSVLTSHAGSVMTSRPRSTGGSGFGGGSGGFGGGGFGGGGFSGGGFGGGGGGGF